MCEELTIIQHNVQAWTRQKQNLLTNIYLKLNPDIILLNSTSILDNEKIKIYNYNIYKKNAFSERHAGIAIGIKKAIKHKIIDSYHEDILTVQIVTRKGPVNISTIYQPPRRNYLPNQDLSSIIHSTTPSYIIGDLNGVHPFIGHNRDNNVGKALYQHIRNNLIRHIGPYFNTLTEKIHQRTVCRPDIVLTNRNAFLNYNITQGPITASDHIPIIVKLSTKPIVAEIVGTPDTKKTNWEQFATKIEDKITEQENENKLENNANITKETLDRSYKIWIKDIENTFKITTPIRRTKLVPHIPDSDLMKTLINQLKLYQKNVNLWNLNTKVIIRNIQNLMIEEANRIQDENWRNKVIKLMEKYKNDIKKFWDSIRRLLGKSKVNIPYLINENGEKVEDQKEQVKLLTETWGKTFTITEEENQTFDQENENMVNMFIRQNKNRTEPYMHPDLNRLENDNPLIKQITTKDIIDALQSFKHKAPGESGVTKQILSKLPPIAWERFRKIVNLAFSMGYYLQINKEGILILPPKQGKDPKMPINRRPITLLEIPGKIIEKILNNRLRQHLENNDKLYKHQHGFRPGRSTETALMAIYETIAVNQNNRIHQCNIICRDISKAFDKVWHAGMIYKILQQGLPIIYEKILSNYLNNRKVKIRDNNETGEDISIKSGVPQGGILSPTLFILYTADIPQTPEHTINIAYADDITQVVTHNGRGKKTLALKTQREIERINIYENKWKIKTNNTKFQLLSISKTKPADIKINNRNIPFNNVVKILGLNFYRTGLARHSTQKIKEARERKRLLQRFGALDKKLRVYLYKMMTRPVFEYPICPTCIMPKTTTKKYQEFQNGDLQQIYYRKVNKNDPNEIIQRKTSEELHNLYKVDPINTRIYKRTKASWEKFKELYPDIVNKSLNLNTQRMGDGTAGDHPWWPRIAKYVEQPEPPPCYH